MSTHGPDIAAWIRRQVTAAGARGLAVGLSGGVDSALVARLCQMAVPANVLGVILPCHGDPQDEVDALLVAGHFAIPTVRVDLAPAFDHLVGNLKTAFAAPPPGQPAIALPDATGIRARRPSAHVKPRLRMSALYFVAGALGYLVAGTANRCDLTIGHFTKYGDGGVDLLPLGALMKSEVRGLARALDVPESIIEKAPGAGLWPGQTDEAEMGFTYADLERYLTDGPDLVPPALAMRIERLVRSSDHKRALPPVPDDEV